jgi:hypothetical protein
MGNGRIDKRHVPLSAIGSLGRLFDSQGNLDSFAVAIANAAISVTGHNQSSETEATTTLDDACASSDLYYCFC